MSLWSKEEAEAWALESFNKNNADYWEAHAQFGSDIELRNAWFHDVGYLAALAKAAEVIASKAGAGFDEKAAMLEWNSCIRACVEVPSPPVIRYLAIGMARWQHARDAARIEALESVLEQIAKTDTAENPPDILWLSDWRNRTKALAQSALKEMS